MKFAGVIEVAALPPALNPQAASSSTRPFQDSALAQGEIKVMRALHKSAVIRFSAIALSMLAVSAQANLVKNHSFETVSSPTGSSFLVTANSTTEIQDWVTDSHGTFLIFPGTATTAVSGISLWPGCATGSTLTDCKSPVTPFPYESPDKGNFLAVDGEPSLSGILRQTITGLVKDHFYRVSFYQAAGQLHDERNPISLCCTGDTTEQWRVSFQGNTTQSQFSPLMKDASQSFVDWQLVSMPFKADSTTEVLGFFALGTPSGIPPMVLLDGISVTGAPEPTTSTLLGVGLLGLLAARRRQKRRA